MEINEIVKSKEFEKNFLKIKKQCRGKRVLLYGTGQLFVAIKETYSFDGLNVVGVSDLKYQKNRNIKEDFEYNAYPPSEIYLSNAEVVVCTLQDSLEAEAFIEKMFNLVKKNVKILPVIKKNRFFGNLKKKISEFRDKKSNSVLVINPDGKVFKKKKIKGLEIVFQGKDSTIKLHEPMVPFVKSKIVCGTDCLVEFAPSMRPVLYSGFYIEAENSTFKAGKDFGMQGGAIIVNGEKGCSMTFGDDCILSADIYARTSDGHAIYDLETKKNKNKAADIVVGNHVWICRGATILKGSVIPDNTVVANSALVNKVFTEENTVIGGVPAKIIQRNVNWHNDFPGNFEDYVE